MRTGPSFPTESPALHPPTVRPHTDVSNWKYKEHKEEAVKITVKKRVEEVKTEEAKPDSSPDKKNGDVPVVS